MNWVNCFEVKKWPELIAMQQKFDNMEVCNISECIDGQFDEIAKTCSFLNKRIAVAVGSRGIAAIDEIVKETIKELKRYGRPYNIKS